MLTCWLLPCHHVQGPAKSYPVMFIKVSTHTSRTPFRQRSTLYIIQNMTMHGIRYPVNISCTEQQPMRPMPPTNAYMHACLPALASTHPAPACLQRSTGPTTQLHCQLSLSRPSMQGRNVRYVHMPKGVDPQQALDDKVGE